jgi:hypothetical protein
MSRSMYRKAWINWIRYNTMNKTLRNFFTTSRNNYTIIDIRKVRDSHISIKISSIRNGVRVVNSGVKNVDSENDFDDTEIFLN